MSPQMSPQMSTTVADWWTSGYEITGEHYGDDYCDLFPQEFFHGI